MPVRTLSSREKVCRVQPSFAAVSVSGTFCHVLLAVACLHWRVTPLHFLRRHLFDAVTDVPAVAEGVSDAARPLAVELVLRLTFDLGARCGGAANHGARIIHR